MISDYPTYRVLFLDASNQDIEQVVTAISTFEKKLSGTNVYDYFDAIAGRRLGSVLAIALSSRFSTASFNSLLLDQKRIRKRTMISHFKAPDPMLHDLINISSASLLDADVHSVLDLAFANKDSISLACECLVTAAWPTSAIEKFSKPVLHDSAELCHAAKSITKQDWNVGLLSTGSVAEAELRNLLSGIRAALKTESHSRPIKFVVTRKTTTQFNVLGQKLNNIQTSDQRFEVQEGEEAMSLIELDSELSDE